MLDQTDGRKDKRTNGLESSRTRGKEVKETLDDGVNKVTYVVRLIYTGARLEGWKDVKAVG